MLYRGGLILLGLLTMTVGTNAQAPKKAPVKAPKTPMAVYTAKRDVALETAVTKGLDWLARPGHRSRRDGSFVFNDTDKPAPIAVMALATMAFLAHGETEGRGRYGREVAYGIQYLLEHQVEAPKQVNDGYFRADNDKHSKTHGHGFATLCLSQALGMTGGNYGSIIGKENRIRSALIRAVKFITRIQGNNGGWYYDDFRNTDAHEGSVTICMVQALRGAHNAGIKVDAKVIALAEDYVKKSQKRDGSFRYHLGSDVSSAALTAAAIATLNMTGNYDDPILTRGVEFMRTKESFIQTERALRPEREQSYPHYRRLYYAQAYWQRPNLREWKRWFALERNFLLTARFQRQRKDGAWHTSKYGAIYATAINCLVLQMQFNYLPIFQR